jgi:hypothetical protein
MREDGCELDRIYITSDPNDKPGDAMELPTAIEKGVIEPWIAERESLMDTRWLSVEAEGRASVEIESVPATKGWAYIADGKGHSGLGYLDWLPPGQGAKAGEGLLQYEFEVNKPGKYQVLLRSRIKDPTNRPDTLDPDGNDIWLRVQGGQPVAGQTPLKSEWNKVAILGHPEGFTWNTNLDVEKSHPVSPVCVYLEKGRCSIELSGRSQGHGIDRLILLRFEEKPIVDFDQAKNMLDAMPNSPIKY